jgi:hypothetical protein
MAKSFLRLALQDIADKGKPIVLSGPLSNVFTQVLNETYANKEPEDGENNPAMESQALDVAAMKQLAAMISAEPAPDSDAIKIYGVSADEVENKDIVAVSQELAQTPLEQRDNFVVIINDTGEQIESLNDSPKEQPTLLATAMESLARAYGVRVYPSLEEFAKDRFN